MSGLEFKPQIIELNNARVNFKHYGNLPSSVDMDKFFSGAHDFLSSTARKIGVRFDDISMADLIKDEKIRKRIKASEHKIQTEDYQDALIETSIAFNELECDARTRIKHGRWNTDGIRNAYEVWHRAHWDKAREFTYALQDILDELIARNAFSNLGYSPDYIFAARKKGFHVAVSKSGKVLGVSDMGQADPSKENILAMNRLIIELAMRLY